jgi:UDP:flavonoid glycosyltransferase YjiC (YdhE family)
MPTGRDQPDNAARITHRGAGLKITKNASPSKIAAAVERVLQDPSFREAARRLGGRIQAETDRGTVLSELDALASPRVPRQQRPA